MQAHNCTSLVLHCIDFRFGKALKNYLDDKGYAGDSDLVVVAGAVKNIVDPKEPTDAEFVLRQIDISKRLHEIKQVVLVNHTDCGAYGGRSAFNSKEDELNRHVGDLKKAAAMIHQKYPDVVVKLALAMIEPDGLIHIEEAPESIKV